jgi:acyl dehydratase
MTAVSASLSVPRVGDVLPTGVHGPITRTMLALYAGASHDHNPIHIDIDVVRSAGMEDVFAHGMLSMAYLAQLLTKWAPQNALREWSVRFTAITPVHAQVHTGGEVVELIERNGEGCARVRIWARTDKGVTTLEGEAIVAVG